jgi:hypothetical protein
MHVDDIPVAYTPEGGWHTMPPPILEGCEDPLVAGAPDLRGLWKVVSVEWRLGDPPDPIPVADHVERIEQAGDRLIVTSSGIIHDMRADGSEEHGVHDVAAVGGQAIHVVCTYEDGVHVLRPVGMPGMEVTRRLDGEQMIWSYGPVFTARLERVG